MDNLSNKQLIEKAHETAFAYHAPNGVRVAEVGCALVTEAGNIYTGVSIHAFCGIGFCAEHSAIAEMVKNKEYRFKKIVAVSDKGEVLPPCGRCREFMYQIDEKNYEADIVLGEDRAVKLSELLPDTWQKKYHQ